MHVLDRVADVELHPKSRMRSAQVRDHRSHHAVRRVRGRRHVHGAGGIGVVDAGLVEGVLPVREHALTPLEHHVPLVRHPEGPGSPLEESQIEFGFDPLDRAAHRGRGQVHLPSRIRHRARLGHPHEQLHVLKPHAEPSAHPG